MSVFTEVILGIGPIYCTRSGCSCFGIFFWKFYLNNSVIDSWINFSLNLLSGYSCLRSKVKSKNGGEGEYRGGEGSRVPELPPLKKNTKGLSSVEYYRLYRPTICTQTSD